MIFVIGAYKKDYCALKKSMEAMEKECHILSVSPRESKTDDMCSIYEYFVRKTEKEMPEEKPLYYAFLDIPYLWAVRADGVNGAVYDRNCKKAEIYFTEPIERRNVQRVEWVEEDGSVYRVDYYNRYGDRYYIEYVCDGAVQSREFYNHAQQLIILEQITESVITLFQDGRVSKRYTGYSEFLQAYLRNIGMQDTDVVFGDEKVWKQFKDMDMKSMRLLDINTDKIYWYNRKSENKFGVKDALILTGTDQVEAVEELITTFPEIKFHIAANTLMSDKLNRLAVHTNVSLYPCVSEVKRKELFERCSLYLDFNHWEEIYDAVPVAVLHSLIVLAFDTTMHHKELTLTEHICTVEETEKMKQTIRLLLSDQMQYNDRLCRQGELFEKLRTAALKRIEA